MNKEDIKTLSRKINSLLDELSDRLKNATGDNLVSLAITGSTLNKQFTYNQDVDLFLVLKTIERENLPKVAKTLREISRGQLDAPYRPYVPKIKKVFKGICQKYSRGNTAVKYKFTLGNYWGKPTSGKKFTIHLHILGPCSISSLRLRIKYQKVIMANAIHNAAAITGRDIRKIVKFAIKPKDVLDVLSMLKARQKRAYGILDSDPGLALQISVKNLAKIAMASLEIKNIFENDTARAGKLFSRYFRVAYKELPSRVLRFKNNKERILKDNSKVKQITEQTLILIEDIEHYISRLDNL